MLYRNELGLVRDSLLVRWTETAKECYKIGCVCSDCKLKKQIKSGIGCRMKPYVIELVKKFGVPDECKKQFTKIEVI